MKVELLSTYQRRSDHSYLASLGQSLVKIIQLVPDGVLVFFPSYSVLKICIDFWKGSSNIWFQLEKDKKCLVEPQDKFAFNEVIKVILESYYYKVNRFGIELYLFT